MAKQIITPSNVYKVRGHSHAIRIDNTIYVAGQVARDEEGNLVGKDDMVAQTERAYENLQRVLKAAGASIPDIVKLTIYCRDLDSFAKTGEIRRKYFGNHFPATTAVEINRLMNPNFLIEVEATAVIA